MIFLPSTCIEQHNDVNRAMHIISNVLQAGHDQAAAALADIMSDGGYDTDPGDILDIERAEMSQVEGKIQVKVVYVVSDPEEGKPTTGNVFIKLLPKGGIDIDF